MLQQRRKGACKYVRYNDVRYVWRRLQKPSESLPTPESIAHVRQLCMVQGLTHNDAVIASDDHVVV